MVFICWTPVPKNYIFLIILLHQLIIHENPLIASILYSSRYFITSMYYPILNVLSIDQLELSYTRCLHHYPLFPPLNHDCWWYTYGSRSVRSIFSLTVYEYSSRVFDSQTDGTRLLQPATTTTTTHHDSPTTCHCWEFSASSSEHPNGKARTLQTHHLLQ